MEEFFRFYQPDECGRDGYPIAWHDTGDGVGVKDLQFFAARLSRKSKNGRCLMAYAETTENGLVTVQLSCDAWRVRGKYLCNNSAEITMQRRDDVLQFLHDLGWRLLRGHQVCSTCLDRGKPIFPKAVAKASS
jgi:hypothetical protein